MGKILATIFVAIKGLKFGIFTGWKGALWAIGAGLASIVVFNTFVDITEIIINTVTSVLQARGGEGTVSPVVADVTGVAAYMFTKLRIVECVSYVISMVILKWTLVKIPFVKW